MESAGREYVFTSPLGGPLRDESWRVRFWNPAVQKVGFDGLTFHDVRHSHAAHLIAAGVHMLVISRRLGHSSIAITMNRYGHLAVGHDESLPDPYA
jgi:integrase